VLDFATSQVAMGKVRVANNKRVQMDPGLLIDAAGQPTTEPGVMYNPPFGAPSCRSACTRAAALP